MDLIDDEGGSHTVFDGGDTTSNGGWLELKLGGTAYKVKKARIWTTAPYASGSGPEQVDAVKLEGMYEEAYSYNGFNQLTGVAASDGSSTLFGYDRNGNQTTKQEGAGPTGKLTTYAYNLDNRLVSIAQGAAAPPPATQWAASATASQSSGTGYYESAQATGAPDTNGCVYAGYAWTPNNTGTEKWLQLGYSLAVKATGVKIHETWGTPFVSKVEALEPDGTAHTVWQGQDATTCGGWLNVAFPPTSYDVTGVKVTTVPRTTGQQPQVDAVELDASTVMAPPVQLGAYEYDANGLRTKKTDSSGTTSYLLDGLSVVAQYAPDSTRQYWYTQNPARIDEPLNYTDDTGKKWYQADALGSVYALASSSGALVGSQGYDVFGAPVPAPTGPAGQPFGFTGREHDLDASLVYARARYLNPGTGGWTQPDPYGESITRNGGIGAEPMVRSLGTGLAFPSPQAPRYAYAEGRPSVFADPSGLMVVYVGVGATASTFAGGTTFGVGMAIGTGTGFSYVPIAFTAGFAVQAYQLINISASVDFSVFWGLEPDEACSIRGPFLTVSMDPGLGFSVSMVWSISWPSLQSFLKTGYMPDLSAALGAPVGLTISPGILPTKWGLPAGGVTIFGTWTWIPYAIGCSACGQ